MSSTSVPRANVEATLKVGSTTRTLFTREIPWARRFKFLKGHGYLLRPRYRPGWSPSWTEGQRSIDCEDSIRSRREAIMDAVRIEDGVVVIFKHISKSSTEAQISRMVSNGPLKENPSNHCIPLIAELDDPDDPEITFLVFPLLRPISGPSPALVGECFDFIDQTMAGLEFLHEQGIAHRDCAWGNIMMDGRALFPKGWHPMVRHRAYDGTHITLDSPSRTRVGGVKYFLIDFGISTIGESKVVGTLGQERAPELSSKIPYNPFKLDVYILGKVYERYLFEEYRTLDFLRDLIRSMTMFDPARRPTAAEAYVMFKDLKSRAQVSASQRLHPPERESALTEFFRDAIYRIKETYWRVTPDLYLTPLA